MAQEKIKIAATKNTLEVYDFISEKIHELQILDEHFNSQYTAEHQELHQFLSKTRDEIRKLKSFYEPDIDKNLEGNLAEQIAEQIKMERNKRGLSQEALANLAGVNRKTIINAESGKQENVSISILRALDIL